MRRQGRINLVKLLFLCALVVGGFYAYAYVPAYMTRMKVAEIVQRSLLEWRDKSLPRAKERLAHELEKEEIPDYLIPEDCEFQERVGKERHLDCYWVVQIRIPFTHKWKEIEFEVHKYLDASDELHDVKIP